MQKPKSEKSEPGSRRRKAKKNKTQELGSIFFFESSKHIRTRNATLQALLN